VLVDAGFPHQEKVILRRLQTLDRHELRLIYITHAHLDHYGSAAALRRLSGARVAIHRADAERMAKGETKLGITRGWGKIAQVFLPLVELFLRPNPVEADVLLEDGEDLSEYGIEAKVLHTPGHTLGSSCLVIEGRVGFVGDMFSMNGRPHLQRFCAEDWSLYNNSVVRLGNLKLERMFPGHGRGGLSGGGLERLISENLSIAD
jgi:hydroxyacylglutathione hydrolase